MKVAIIGVGAVGKACATALLLRGSCSEIILHDQHVNLHEGREYRLDQGVATDLLHGAQLCPPVRVRHGDYEDFVGACIVVITAGINERSGGAISRKDPRGRLLLLARNAEIYAEIVPKIAAAAPDALILVVTDPPDPLADVARRYTQSNPVLSSGTYLDTLRFRVQIAARLGCHPASVDAFVLGEHGTSQVYVWSSAQVGGTRVRDLIDQQNLDWERFRTEVEDAVKFANIGIIEGTGASQHGIGIVTARIIEAIARDEGLVAPIGILHSPRFAVTLSLPVVLGRGGVTRVLAPQLEADEQVRLDASAAVIAAALADLPK